MHRQSPSIQRSRDYVRRCMVSTTCLSLYSVALRYLVRGMGAIHGLFPCANKFLINNFFLTKLRTLINIARKTMEFGSLNRENDTVIQGETYIRAKYPFSKVTSARIRNIFETPKHFPKKSLPRPQNMRTGK